MASALFVDPADVAKRMQLTQNLAGMIDVISDAILGAQAQVEAIIGCTITRKSQDCMFFLDGDAFSGIQPDGLFRLEVPSGLIRRDTPIALFYSSDTFDSTEEGPFGTQVLSLGVDYKIDYIQGIIFAEAGKYRDRYVRVQCDTGFEPGTNPLPLTGLLAYDNTHTYTAGDKVAYNGVAYTAIVQSIGHLPTDVNFWNPAFIPKEKLPFNLEEAIKSYVPSVFDSSQVSNRNSQAQPLYKIAQDRAQLLLKDYIRMRGFMHRPIWS
jgi:hypothetical protein